MDTKKPEEEPYKPWEKLRAYLGMKENDVWEFDEETHTITYTSGGNPDAIKERKE